MNADGLTVLYATEPPASGASSAVPCARAPSHMNRSPQPSFTERSPLGAGERRRAAFDTELASHADELLVFMRARLRDTEAAADLAQEALARMMRYRDTPGIRSLRKMLYRIAYNLINDAYNAQQCPQAPIQLPPNDLDQLSGDQPSVEETAIYRQLIDMLVRHTIRNLPARCRTAFVLCRFEGLTYPQTAARMGISVKMVEKHVMRALQACRDAVGDLEA